MSLIQEINRTETEKNKTKIVATNIDNKLVELGGERATNLADVPNKINKMIIDNYKKVAILEKSITFKKTLQTVEIKINLDFKPQRILIHALSGDYPDQFADTKYKGYNLFYYNPANDNGVEAIIKSWTKSAIVLEDLYGKNFTFAGTINCEIICIE